MLICYALLNIQDTSKHFKEGKYNHSIIYICNRALGISYFYHILPFLRATRLSPLLQFPKSHWPNQANNSQTSSGRPCVNDHTMMKRCIYKYSGTVIRYVCCVCMLIGPNCTLQVYQEFQSDKTCLVSLNINFLCLRSHF